MPRLSVLMPPQRRPATIERAVRSVLRDLPGDSELLVADDGSARQALACLDDRRLRLFPAHERSVSRTMAAMLSSSDSEFVARMDADAVVVPGRFRRQLRALQDTDVVFATAAAARGSGRSLQPLSATIPPDAFPFHLLLSIRLEPSTVAARRDAIESAGGYRPAPDEDDDLWLRLAADGARLRRLAVPAVIHSAVADRVAETGGWQERSTQEPFAVLSAQLLGTPQQPIAALAAAPMSASAKLARFREFDHRFRAAVSPLSLIDRRVLLHRLGRCAEWLWERMLHPSRAWTTVGSPQHPSAAPSPRQESALSDKTEIGALA